MSCFTDLLLHLDSYPDPVSARAIEGAVRLAAAVGGKVTACAYEVVVPLESNPLADWLTDLSSLVHQAEARSSAACDVSLQIFEQNAKSLGVFAKALKLRVNMFNVAEDLAKRARTRDLTLVPLTGSDVGIAQSVVFGSGNPVLIFKPGRAEVPASFQRVAVAWDGGACAARAVAAAMPILSRAREVRVFTIVGEKPSATAGLSCELVRHLKGHSIEAEVDEAPARGRGIGAAFDAYLRKRPTDLIVMGGFGHSRLREFILGGATEHALTGLTTPVLLAH